MLFSQLVDDPSSWPERFPTEDDQRRERERLHRLIERLVPWEASNDERVLNEARFEIARSLAWGRGEEPPPANNPDAVRNTCWSTPLPSTTRSAAAARSRSRPSAWACAPTAPTSTRWR